MNVNLHIERLVLDGLSVTSRGGAELQVALELELARLLAEKPGMNWRSNNLPQLSLVTTALPHDVNPGKWGREVARTLHNGLSKAGATNSILRRPALPANEHQPKNRK
jgi:hypothetical protein